jgi:chromosome segregation ATPase
MKSAFQSQISSLTATLKGKDAEVSSLKGAVEDAERRVGEALEEIRNERGAKESLQNEKLDWEKREQEMKDVLRSVKEEIVRNDREKDHLLQRVTEAEYKREEAETKVLEAESKMAGMKAGSSSTAPSENGSSTGSEVEAAVSKVAKELHGLYKSKHETKVTALKKSYSDRWEKKVRDLQAKIDELSKENEDLRVGRDATMTGVDPGNMLPSAESEEQKKERETEKQRFEAQKPQLKNVERELLLLQSELTRSKETNASLISELEAYRRETANLIAAAEDLMSLSQSAMSNGGSERSKHWRGREACDRYFE